MLGAFSNNLESDLVKIDLYFGRKAYICKCTGEGLQYVTNEDPRVQASTLASWTSRLEYAARRVSR